MAIEIEKISAERLKLLPIDQTVFFFSVGPLEDHGPHLPLGLDLLEADRLVKITAERLEKEMPGWTAVIMPRAPLGIDADTTEVRITVRPHVLRDWLVDSCRALSKIGFRYFVCFSGHLGPKQLTAIEEAARMLRKRERLGILGLMRRSRGPILVSASSALVTKKEALSAALWPDPKEHGGARDTSVALAIAPELVAPEFKNNPPFIPHTTRWERALARLRGKISGYWGDPAAGTAEAGNTVLRESIDQIFVKLRAVWDGAYPDGLFRSWYSVFPPNKSFFKAWLLIFGFGLLIVIWVLAAFQYLLG